MTKKTVVNIKRIKKYNMKEHKLPIPKEILLTLAIFGFLIVIISAYLKIYNKDFSQNYSELGFGIALLFLILPWFVVLIDLIRNHIRNKIMWFVGMFAFGSLTVILYLINREKHLRLYKKFETI